MAEDDERRRELPPWKEFRDRYADEQELSYTMLKMQYDIRQGRDRDHWLVSQFNAVLNNVEILRNDLIGDGTVLRRGFLNELLDNQNEIKDKLIHNQNEVRDNQANTRDVVVAEIREQRNEQQAQSWTVAKKWIYTTSSAAIGAVVAALLIFLVLHHP